MRKYAIRETLCATVAISSLGLAAINLVESFQNQDDAVSAEEAGDYNSSDSFNIASDNNGFNFSVLGTVGIMMLIPTVNYGSKRREYSVPTLPVAEIPV